MNFIRATQIQRSIVSRAENRFAPPGDSRFPYVLTTYRLTEHHTAAACRGFSVI